MKAANGTVSAVTMRYRNVDAKGKAGRGTVKGTLSKDRTTWTAGARLEPGATYTLEMTGRNAEQTASVTTTFKTPKLTLAQQTYPEVYPLEGSEVGVGMPVVVRFDVPVTDRAEVERNLHVTSSPRQTGSWRWYSDTEVHYRPAKYWRSGTRVSLDADLNGVRAGKGVYGQQSASTSFTVGRSLVTRVDLANHRATVYRDGEQVRTIPISRQAGLGDPQRHQADHGQAGHHPNDQRDDRGRGGLRPPGPVRDADHQLRGVHPRRALELASFGRRNASHGCVGMSTTDARWLFDRVLVGDLVVTTGSSRGVEPGHGCSDWNASFEEYQNGSAL